MITKIIKIGNSKGIRIPNIILKVPGNTSTVDMLFDEKENKTCSVISPDEMNNNMSTIILALLTTQSHSYPTRVQLKFLNKTGYIVLNQIRTIDTKKLLRN